MIRRGQLSLVKQCELLSIYRSGIYYQPKGETALNLELMRQMDEHYLHHPFKGAKTPVRLVADLFFCLLRAFLTQP